MLTEIHLRDFRCFEALTFLPAPGLNFIIGANAQGKTSLLEAICVLLRLQSPRSTTLAEAVRFGCPAFSLDGHFAGRHLQIKVSEKEKHYALDSKPQSRMSDYLAIGRVVWISNDDIQLVRGGGAARRRYLDFLAAQVEPSYLHNLRTYERALRSRNALLKDNRPRQEIEAFDEVFIESGIAIQQTRASIVKILQPLTCEACREITGGQESLAISFIPANQPDLAEALKESRAEEMRLKTTVVGPHRDDLALVLDNLNASSFASEGQQRGIALALKIAQARMIEQTRQIPPLFLIDDIFGELDPFRRNNLLQSLPITSQKIATTTMLTWMSENSQITRFELANGAIRQTQ